MRKYQFGDFELDLDGFELRLRGEPVKLERRPLDLLVLLVKQPGHMVSREEIVAALWPAKVIIDFDAGLNTLVRKVRAALGDSSEEPKYIETVPGRGYRFIAAITEPVAATEPITAVAETGPASEASASGAYPATQSGRSWRPSRIATSLALLLVAGPVIVFWYSVATPPVPPRIAVFPFETRTGDESLADFASGLTANTNAALSQVDHDNLRVVPVPTRALIESTLTIPEIGRSVGVEYVVQGSLRMDGTQIRVSAQLVRVADGELVCCEPIDRELTNELALQHELSLAIAEQIRLRLSPEVAGAIEQRQRQSPAAYDLYLRGREEWLKLTPDSMKRSLGYFQQAIDEDPNYAPAWAGIAFAEITSLRTADADPAVVKPRALEALLRAEELGPDLVETRYARGYYSLFGDQDRSAAQETARQAIKLDANNAQAHLLLGVSVLVDRPVESLEMLRRARELDPMFALAWANSANAALQAEDAEGALEFARQTVAINEEFWLGHYYLGHARRALGDEAGALQAYADADRLSGGHSLTYSARVSVLVELGLIEEARGLIAELTAQADDRYVPAYTLGVENARFGETETAFYWLDRAVEAGDLGLRGLYTNTILDPLRDDPRFEALLLRCDCRP